VALCHATARADYGAELLDREGVERRGGGHLLEIPGLRQAQTADLIRLWLLAKYGGVWLDVDIISNRPIPFLRLAEPYPDVALFGFAVRNLKRFPNCILYAPRPDDRLGALLDAAVAEAKRGGKMRYTALGSRLLSRARAANPAALHLWPRRPYLHPFHGAVASSRFKRLYRLHWDHDCYAAHMCSGAMGYFAGDSRLEVTQSPSMFGVLLSRALRGKS
jgi:hypothetical protein